MTLLEALKLNIIKGTVKVPESPEELLDFVDRCLALEKVQDDVGEKIDSMKLSFLQHCKTRSKDGKSQYASQIRGDMKSKATTRFNLAHKLAFGHDAHIRVIHELVQEGKIKMFGKRVRLLDCDSISSHKVGSKTG